MHLYSVIQVVRPKIRFRFDISFFTIPYFSIVPSGRSDYDLCFDQC